MKKFILYDISLIDQVQRTSIGATAKAMGVTNGAVWQMLRDEREVYLIRAGKRFTYVEVKKYDRRKPAKKRKAA